MGAIVSLCCYMPSDPEIRQCCGSVFSRNMNRIYMYGIIGYLSAIVPQLSALKNVYSLSEPEWAALILGPLLAAMVAIRAYLDQTRTREDVGNMTIRFLSFYAEWILLFSPPLTQANAGAIQDRMLDFLSRIENDQLAIVRGDQSANTALNSARTDVKGTIAHVATLDRHLTTIKDNLDRVRKSLAV